MVTKLEYCWQGAKSYQPDGKMDKTRHTGKAGKKCLVCQWAHTHEKIRVGGLAKIYIN